MTQHTDDEVERLRAIGACLRRKRKQHRMTQDDLAERMPGDRNYLGQVERGLRNASILFFVRAAEAMDITLSELFGDCP